MDRMGLSKGTLIQVLIPTIIVSNILQYLWLFKNIELHFYLWGFPLVAPVILPACIPFFVLVRKCRNGLKYELKRFGAIRFWIAGIIFPIIAVIVIVMSNLLLYSEAIDFNQQWNALALSTMFDLPVTFVWFLPLLISIEIASRLFIRSCDGFDNWSGAFLASLSWVLMNAGLIFYFGIKTHPSSTYAFIILAFTIGLFLFRMQSKGSIYSASLSLLITVFALVLVFGSNTPQINQLLFGSDIHSVAGLFEDGNSHLLPPIIGALVLCLFSFFLKFISSKKYS